MCGIQRYLSNKNINILIYHSVFSHVTRESQVGSQAGNNPKWVKQVIIYVFSSFLLSFIQLLCTCQ